MRAANFRQREIERPVRGESLRVTPRRQSGNLPREAQNGAILLGETRREMLIDRMSHRLDHMAIHDRDDILESLEICLERLLTGVSDRD